MKNSEAEWIIKLLKEYNTTVQKSKISTDYDKTFYGDKISELIAWVKLADVAVYSNPTSEREIVAELVGDDLVKMVAKKKIGVSAKKLLDAIAKNDGLAEEDEPVIIDF